MDDETVMLNVRVPAVLMQHIEGVAASKKWTVSRTVRTILRQDYAREQELAELKGYEEMLEAERQANARAAFADDLPGD